MYPQAAQGFRSSIDLEPNNPLPYIGLAETLIIMNGSELEILSLLEQGVRVSDEDPYLLTDAGWLMVDLDDCERAVEMFNRALDLEPNMFEAQDGLDECEDF